MTLLLFKIDKEHWAILKTVTNYLGYLYTHELKDTQVDIRVIKMLKEL
jgi:predicted transcriptional regulator